MLPSFLLVAAVFGTGTFGAGLPSTINQQCFTQYIKNKPRSVMTADFDTSLTKTATNLLRVTPKTTVTPPAITSTVSTTKTSTGTVTAPTTTDIYTTTKTNTVTSTEIDTSSFTQLVTSTTTQTIQSTTTVAPPVGFTGLAQWPGYYPRRNVHARQTQALQERDTNTFHLPTIAPVSPANNGTALLHARAAAGVQYPWRVFCTRSITYFSTKISTVTAPTSTITVAVPTSWSTTTIPATTTITFTPADVTQLVTIPVTVSTTSTTVTSTTSTKTQTNTVFAPIATFLAQCATNNQVSSAVGQKIGTVSYNPAFVLQSLYPKDQTGYGCCAQCAQTANCAGYAQAPLSAGGACYYLITDGRCDAQQSFGDKFHYYNTNGNGYTVGNGQCGFFNAQAGVPVTG